MQNRRIEPADAANVAALCGELGYPATAADVAARLARLRSSADDAVFVADDDRVVVGWIHGTVRALLESDPYVEIGGLVVDQRRRRAGIGRLLMLEAERWAMTRGCTRVRLRSNITRTAAHAFYQRLGYRIAKTQYAFDKPLPRRS